MKTHLCFAILTLTLACGADGNNEEPVKEPSNDAVACGSSKLHALSHDACSAMDAKAAADPEAGSCDCILGYAWDGTKCTMLGDCFCEGEDCDKLTMDKSECEEAHSGC